MAISVIIPTYNEAEGIADLLTSLQPWRSRGHELIVADGGSSDGTLQAASGLSDLIMSSRPGRASQMNAGAGQASKDILLFLHADTRLPDTADTSIGQGLHAAGLNWGRFDVQLSGRRPVFRLIELLMNRRSRLTHICTGDQAMFVRAGTFERLGGFSPLPLMEDIDLSRRLKQHGPPLCLRQKAMTSSRRWEEEGTVRTILVMWSLRLAYWLGVSPDRLARIYYGPKSLSGLRQRGSIIQEQGVNRRKKTDG